MIRKEDITFVRIAISSALIEKKNKQVAQNTEIQLTYASEIPLVGIETRKRKPLC